ncbi:hypothetical protein BZB76_3256 [Actinomadura pelletieri DSM 43383]|uniref:Uncharacterized protein n=1 Tax=Actinomadura pelletieri DSM 43383 TaxID=1120940 RepID=A0A495QP73_9ACTN|nr:hypothetical protein [Actinomadura pelletieri]RKS74737.1 hypothetical protein BZB76_3256 [Actinomadura pelletieri DSM 43383]
MTKDVVALVGGEPDLGAVVAGMVAAGSEWRVERVADGGAVRLCDDDGRAVVTIETPVMVEVAGELTRLLGREVGEVETPVWWVEARGDEFRAGSEVVALRFAARLVERLGGKVWVGDPEYVRGVT